MTNPLELVPDAPGDDGQLRQGGRSLLLALYTALRSLKLYPLEKATVQKSLSDLDGVTRSLLQTEIELEIRLAGDFIFVNSTRLRRELGRGPRGIEAGLRAKRGGDEGCDRRSAPGSRHRPQAGKTRSADGGRSGAEQRDLDGGFNHPPRVRRVHVHSLRERLHLFRRLGQETRLFEGAALRSRHGGAVTRRRKGPSPSGGAEQAGEVGRARMAPDPGPSLVRRPYAL